MHVRRNPPLTADGAAELPEALIEIWAAVTNAGGAVGFIPPVTAEDVRAVAEAAFDRVRAGVDDLVVAYRGGRDVAGAGGRPVAFGFLVTNEFPLARHWATVKRLQRHPDVTGRGVGGLVLAELEACAVDRGLERVCLTVRGQTGRERFYAAQGYRLDARLPGRLRLAEGITVEELHMSKVVGPAAEGAPPAPLSPVLRVKRLVGDIPLPSYARAGDAGLDLRAARDVHLAPGQRATVPTGIAIALPAGHVGLVHPRSGLASRHGLALVNAPGTIDEGYRGEVRVVVVNLDPEDAIVLARGERIAQLVIQPVSTVVVEEVADLEVTERGSGGFGSTGR